MYEIDGKRYGYVRHASLLTTTPGRFPDERVWKDLGIVRPEMPRFPDKLVFQRPLRDLFGTALRSTSQTSQRRLRAWRGNRQEELGGKKKRELSVSTPFISSNNDDKQRRRRWPLYQKRSSTCKASRRLCEEAGATSILVAFRTERGSILTTAPKTSTSRADSSRRKTAQPEAQTSNGRPGPHGHLRWEHGGSDRRHRPSHGGRPRGPSSPERRWRWRWR